MLFGTSGMDFASRGEMVSGGRSVSRTQQLGRNYQPFANPFFDHASTFLPSSVKHLFGFCRHLYLTNGLVHAIVTKTSEYPVTDLLLQHASEGVENHWKEFLFEIFDYRTFQFETNLDYQVTGNAFASPSYPFRKILHCGSCSAEHLAVESRPFWRYINHQFWLQCPKCGQSDFARAEDRYLPIQSELRMMRWNPENVTLFYNEVTGKRDYALELSNGFRSQITSGRKDLIATTPAIFLEAVKTRRSIVFDPTQVFHLRRPSPSSADSGWGVPALMPVLKDAYLMQVMKKANEAVLLTHVLPQIFLFPQPATGGADPFTTASLSTWRSQLQREIARQRADPAYYGILPFPVGHQVIGGNGRNLLMVPEMQQLAEHLIIGMGYPPDLIFGHGTFAGNSVTMRMVENAFQNIMRQQTRLLRWSIRKIASFLEWPVPTARFKPFRMADDLQRAMLMLQMRQTGDISRGTFLQTLEIPAREELQLQLSELQQYAELDKQRQTLMASSQGEAQVISAKFQARAQQAANDAMARQMQVSDPFVESQQTGQAGPGASLDAVAAMLADRVRSMPPDQQQVWMRQLQTAVPETAQLLEQQMAMPGMPEDMAQAAGQPPVDMRPMPEQLPPRRPGGV